MSQILIKDVPLEVRKYIYQLQAELRLQRNGTSQYSQSSIIIKIIKQQMALEESKSKKQ